MELIKKHIHWLYLAFALFLPLHLYTLYGRMAINYADMPIDARNLYLLVKSAAEHDNFYSDANVKKTWKEITAKENIESKTPGS